MQSAVLNVTLVSDRRSSCALWQVKLLVVDSVAAPFRSQQLQHQAVMLETIATSLRQIASLGVAVVVVNHVVGTVGQGSPGIKPALGELPTMCYYAGVLVVLIEDDFQHLVPSRCVLNHA